MILSLFEFLIWFNTISMCWVVKSYDFMSQLAILTTLVVLHPRFLLNPQVHHISSCPIYILQIARQQQHLLFAFRYLKSLHILSNSFSNVVQTLSMSRYDVIKFWYEGNQVLLLSRLNFPILSISLNLPVGVASRLFLIHLPISGVLELQIRRGQICWKANISGYIFY
jgi:hypothetical protein